MPMYRGLIVKAKEDAQNFIAACDEALQRLDQELERKNGSRAYRNEDFKPQPPSIGDYSYGSRETGTLRRKSMDLTRILADLRARP